MAQAGRRWQRTLFPWLKSFGFTASEHDPCLFHLSRVQQTPDGPRTERLLLGVYVDDLATAFSHDDEHSLYHEFTTALQQWSVEDEGELHEDLLGVDFSRADRVIKLSQSKYIDKLVSTYLSEGVPSTFQRNRRPYDEDLPLEVADAVMQSADSIDPTLLKRYQSLVGALLYCATNTRPDVAYPVGMLCRAMGKPTPELYIAAERVLCYLHRTRELGLRSETCVPDGHVCVRACRVRPVGVSAYGVYVDMAVCSAPVPGTQLVWDPCFSLKTAFVRPVCLPATRLEA